LQHLCTLQQTLVQVHVTLKEIVTKHGRDITELFRSTDQLHRLSLNTSVICESVSQRVVQVGDNTVLSGTCPSDTLRSRFDDEAQLCVLTTMARLHKQPTFLDRHGWVNISVLNQWYEQCVRVGAIHHVVQRREWLLDTITEHMHAEGLHRRTSRRHIRQAHHSAKSEATAHHTHIPLNTKSESAQDIVDDAFAINTVPDNVIIHQSSHVPKGEHVRVTTPFKKPLPSIPSLNSAFVLHTPPSIVSDSYHTVSSNESNDRRHHPVRTESQVSSNHSQHAGVAGKERKLVPDCVLA
jgi:hypothetical protein